MPKDNDVESKKETTFNELFKSLSLTRMHLQFFIGTMCLLSWRDAYLCVHSISSFSVCMERWTNGTHIILVTLNEAALYTVAPLLYVRELATCNLHSPNRHNPPSKTCLSQRDSNRHDRYAAVTGHKLHPNNSTKTSRRQRRFASLTLVANPLCFDSLSIFGKLWITLLHIQTRKQIMNYSHYNMGSYRTTMIHNKKELT